MCYNLMTLKNTWQLTMFKESNDLYTQNQI